MGKFYLHAPRIPLSRGTAKANRINFRSITTCARFPSCLLLAATMLMHADAPVVSAQGRIIAMEKNRRRVKTPTTEVTRILRATRNSESATVPMNVEIGDSLIGKSGLVTVKVVCNSKAELVLSGNFKRRFLRAQENGGCDLFDEGTKGSGTTVRARGPTQIQSAEARLGSARTWYEWRSGSRRYRFMRFLRGLGVPPEVFVFEGEVTIKSPFFSGIVKEGEKLVPTRSCPAVIKKLESKDYRLTAERYARLDASQVPDPTDLNAVFLKLASLYQAILENPRDQTKWTALKKAQEELGIPITEP